MKKVKIKVLQGEEWQIEGDLVLKKEKIYVLKDEELRVEIIQWYYDMLAARYGRQWKITELVTKNYWWPGVIRDVEKYVKECDLC